MDESGRRYTDREFALILRMAAEGRSATDEALVPSGEGMTLSEMTQIAAEVGIDPSLVRQAAWRLTDVPAEESSWLVGGPTRHSRRDVVEGTMDPESAARVVDAVRDVVGQSGAVQEELGRLVWTTVGEVSQIQVAIAPGEDRTEVVVSADRNGAFVLTWAFPVLGGMVGAGIVGAITEPATVAGGVALFGGMATGGLAVARALWGRSTKAVRKKLDRVLRETARAIASVSERA